MKKICSIVLLLFVLFQIPVVTYADNEKITEKAEYETIEDLVPVGTETEEFHAFFMNALTAAERSYLWDEDGLALVYAAAALDYDFFNNEDYKTEGRLSVDYLGNGYVGFFRHWIEVLLCIEKDEYICVLYDLDSETASFYRTGVYTAEEAKSMMEESLPNRDCARVDTLTVLDMAEEMLIVIKEASKNE